MLSCHQPGYNIIRHQTDLVKLLRCVVVDFNNVRDFWIFATCWFCTSEANSHKSILPVKLTESIEPIDSTLLLVICGVIFYKTIIVQKLNILLSSAADHFRFVPTLLEAVN